MIIEDRCRTQRARLNQEKLASAKVTKRPLASRVCAFTDHGGLAQIALTIILLGVSAQRELEEMTDFVSKF